MKLVVLDGNFSCQFVTVFGNSVYLGYCFIGFGDVPITTVTVFAVCNIDAFLMHKRKKQSIKHRADCFDYLNDKGFIMSSEEPAMQLLNHLALVHHGPFTLRPQENGQARIFKLIPPTESHLFRRHNSYC